MLELKIKSTIFDRTRKLSISPSFISFDDRSSVGLEPTVIQKSEVDALRYGVRAIRGYQFRVGRIYCIDVKNVSGKVIHIRLKSIYGIHKKQLQEKYIAIVAALHENFFDDIVRSMMQKINEGQEIELLGVVFTAEGVQLKRSEKMLPWWELGTRSYATYYTIFSESNPNQYKAFVYSKDWNAPLVHSLSRSILHQKGLYSD